MATLGFSKFLDFHTFLLLRDSPVFLPLRYSTTFLYSHSFLDSPIFLLLRDPPFFLDFPTIFPLQESPTFLLLL